MAIQKKPNALDLGALQLQAEEATAAFKAASAALRKAIEAQERAEAEYYCAQKSLTVGVQQLQAATKVV